MKDDFNTAIETFKNALSSLEQGIHEAKGDLEKDGLYKDLNSHLNYYGSH